MDCIILTFFFLLKNIIAREENFQNKSRLQIYLHKLYKIKYSAVHDAEVNQFFYNTI